MSQIHDDFWRTKGELIDQIAAIYINNLIKAFNELNYKKGATEYVDHFCTVGFGGFMPINHPGTSNYTSEVHKTIREEVKSLSFLGYNVSNLIDSLYYENKDNEKGDYLTPLMELFHGEFKHSQEKRSDGTIINLLGPSFYGRRHTLVFDALKYKKHFFSKPTANCKLRLLNGTFVQEFMMAIDKYATNLKDYKIAVEQEVMVEYDILSPKINRMVPFAEFTIKNVLVPYGTSDEIEKACHGHFFLSCSIKKAF